MIHRYVELLDKYFGSVCELDIIFNFEKVPGVSTSVPRLPAAAAAALATPDAATLGVPPFSHGSPSPRCACCLGTQ